jgi:hypothetical protein
MIVVVKRADQPGIRPSLKCSWNFHLGVFISFFNHQRDILSQNKKLSFRAGLVLKKRADVSHPFVFCPTNINYILPFFLVLRFIAWIDT